MTLDVVSTIMTMVHQIDRNHNPCAHHIKTHTEHEQIKLFTYHRLYLYVTGPSGSQPLVNPFADPNLWEKIANDPTTREYMTDPEYKEKVTALSKDPKKLG